MVGVARRQTPPDEFLRAERSARDQPPGLGEEIPTPLCTWGLAGTRTRSPA